MVDRAHKGHEFDPVSYKLDPSKLSEFLFAIEDENPVWKDAKTPVPPTFTTLVSFWAGGGMARALKTIDVDIWTVLHGEQEYTYLTPIYVGDTLTSRTRIDDIYTRAGMDFIVFMTDFQNQAGEPVLTERALVIVRGEGAE